MSCAGPARGTQDALARRRHPSFEGAGVVASKSVKDEVLLDEKIWDREESLDLLAQRLAELHEEFHGCSPPKKELAY